MTAVQADLRGLIRSVPGFPREGIVFRDITPVLASPDGLRAAIDGLAAHARGMGADVVLGAEARGFLLGPAIAAQIGAAFVPARKPGRLPRATVGADYALEYGSDRLEVHADAIAPGARVLVHDDLLATGGTAAALCALVAAAGAEVASCGFLVELAVLGGRERLAPHDVHALVAYEEE